MSHDPHESPLQRLLRKTSKKFPRRLRDRLASFAEKAHFLGAKEAFAKTNGERLAAVAHRTVLQSILDEAQRTIDEDAQMYAETPVGLRPRGLADLNLLLTPTAALAIRDVIGPHLARHQPAAAVTPGAAWGALFRYVSLLPFKYVLDGRLVLVDASKEQASPPGPMGPAGVAATGGDGVADPGNAS